MAPIVQGMALRPDLYKPIICVTGQHRHMLDQVLDAFNVSPDYDLALMKKKQSLSELTANILRSVDKLLAKVELDLLIVQGDTTTAFAGALSAFYNKVPVAHVEAGLRTGNIQNPFPEELNRVLVDHMACICFAPTEQNRRTLEREGIPSSRIHVTGNTGIDALLWMREKVRNINTHSWDKYWQGAKKIINDQARPLVLITVHRRESFGATLANMFSAIRNLAIAYPKWSFIFPVHLNPNVQEPARKLLADVPNMHLIDPLPYPPFVYLMSRANLILTDSGGIQEEALSLGKTVFVMRENTERQEAVETGAVIIVGTDPKRVTSTVGPILAECNLAELSRSRSNPYGDGNAAMRILDILAKNFGNSFET